MNLFIRRWLLSLLEGDSCRKLSAGKEHGRIMRGHIISEDNNGLNLSPLARAVVKLLPT